MNSSGSTAGLTSILLLLALIKETPALETKTLQTDGFGKLTIIGDADHRKEMNVKSLPKIGLTDLSLHFVNLNWDVDEPEFLENITLIYLNQVVLNPASLTFSNSLNEVTLVNTTFTNGTLVDFLRTASNLTELNLGDMGEVDISKPPGTPQDIDAFPSTLTRLYLTDTILKREGTSPLSLSSLEFARLTDSELNPNDVTFGDKLSYLILNTMKLVNGTLGDLLRTATNLDDLSIYGGLIVEVNLSELPGTIREVGFQGLNIVNKGSNGVGVQTLPNLKILGFLQVNWKVENMISAENLEEVDIAYSKINANSIIFSERLQSMRLQGVKIINGTLYDFMRTATNISSLDIRYFETIDFSKLRIDKSATRLSIENSQLITSGPVKFINLKELDLISCGTLEMITFRNFGEMFPNIERFLTDDDTMVSPAVFLSILKCPHLKYLRVVFDFEPRVRTYKFEQVVRLLSGAGFDQNTTAKLKGTIHSLFLMKDDGKRNCPGEIVARTTLFIAISNHIRVFKFEPHSKHGVTQIIDLSGFTLSPAPFTIRATSRK